MSNRYWHSKAIYRNMNVRIRGRGLGYGPITQKEGWYCLPRTLCGGRQQTNTQACHGIICFAASSIQWKTDPGMTPRTRRDAANTPPQTALPRLGVASGCRASLSWV
jgi:hypothetical protein